MNADTLDEFERAIVAREHACFHLEETADNLVLAQRRHSLRPRAARDALALLLCDTNDTAAMETLLRPYLGNEHLLVSPLVGLAHAIGNHFAGDPNHVRDFLEQLALHLASEPDRP